MIDIDVVLSPGEPLPDRDIWLVIDVLRATTNIVTFFERGGKYLLPVSEVEEAFALRERFGRDCLLMGERNTLPPEGFDLGNSPLSYTSSMIEERPLAVMTTTNGTAAILRARNTGGVVLAACARNASAVTGMALKETERIGILCAGLYGRTALDDLLCSGLMVENILSRHSGVRLSDGARIALTVWRECGEDLFTGIISSEHGCRLRDLGMEADIAFCCEENRTNVVPRLAEWRGLPAFTSSAG